MPITRLGLVTPAANANTVLATFSGYYLVSVIAANKASTATPIVKASIYVVPSNAGQESQYAYIAYNLALDLGSSFETFRFAVNTGDTLYVRSTTATTSFSCNGIAQSDAVLAENLAQTFTNKTILGNNNTIYVDKGTTAERIDSADVGYIRFNTETNNLEYKAASGWMVVSSS
jgi:hypothetical protein